MSVTKFLRLKHKAEKHSVDEARFGGARVHDGSRKEGFWGIYPNRTSKSFSFVQILGNCPNSQESYSMNDLLEPKSPANANELERWLDSAAERTLAVSA